MDPEAPRVVPAREYKGDLLERLVALRNALKAREEALPPAWPEDAFREIREGNYLAWVLLRGGIGAGMVVLALRNGRAYGHIHLEDPAATEAERDALLEAVRRGVPPPVRRCDITVSTPDPETEARWMDALAARTDWKAIRRQRMVRPLELEDPPGSTPLPPGFRFAKGTLVPQGDLARLDWEAFRDGPDAAMVAESVEENRRLLEGLLRGDLGAPIPDASPAVLTLESGAHGPGGSLAGFALTLEQTPRRALLADIAIHPRFRRQHLGEALLRRTLRGLLALGFREVSLWVTEANGPARTLYEKLGFRRDLSTAILRWERGEPGTSPRTP